MLPIDQDTFFHEVVARIGECASAHDKSRLAEALFLLGNSLDCINWTDIDVQIDSIDDTPTVRWFDIELPQNGAAWKIALELDVINQHP